MSFNSMYQNRVIPILTLITLFSISTAAFAGQQPDPASFTDTTRGFLHFFEGVRIAIHAVLASEVLNHMALTFWKFFTITGLTWLCVQYAMRGVSFVEVFVFIFVLLLTRVLMQQYDFITSALWGFSEAFASQLQIAITGNGDLFWLARYIWNALTATSFGVTTMLHPIYLITIIILEIISVLLCVLGAFATVWALWGYALSKMIGFMFIPFILFERLSWLFDGWLRFFIGFLLYNIVARASLILVVVALQEYFNLPSNTIPTHTAMSFQLSSLTDAVGMLSFLLLSIAGLLSTSRFVAHIVGGGSFSVTASVRQMATSIGTAVSIFL